MHVYLCELYNLNYTATTIAYCWHPIYDILLYNNVLISDEIINLYIFIKEQARPRVDKKLPVSHTLLNQQLEALDLFLTPGYENTLAKAMLATAWAAQLHVSEYSSSLVADIQAGDDHNLHQNNVLMEKDGLTVIFASDKTSLQCKEHFIPWGNAPINNFQQIMQDYNSVRNRTSPVFFCHEDGTNLTPNDMANLIELSTSQTDWRGLKITSHCYRIGGTSYLYRSGLNIPNLQRSGRWSHTDNSSVEHYLKPGLYSASPNTIRNTLPQYKATMSISRALFLRDIITTAGGLDHPFNAVLKSLGFPNLQCTAYPTNRVQQVYKVKQTAAIAAKFLQKVKDKRSRLAKMNIKRANTATHLKVEIKHWRLRHAPLTYGSMTDIRRHRQCFSCQSIQWCACSSEAKIQSL